MRFPSAYNMWFMSSALFGQSWSQGGHVFLSWQQPGLRWSIKQKTIWDEKAALSRVPGKMAQGQQRCPPRRKWRRSSWSTSSKSRLRRAMSQRPRVKEQVRTLVCLSPHATGPAPCLQSSLSSGIRLKFCKTRLFRTGERGSKRAVQLLQAPRLPPSPFPSVLCWAGERERLTLIVAWGGVTERQATFSGRQGGFCRCSAHVCAEDNHGQRQRPACDARHKTPLLQVLDATLVSR